MRSTQHLKTGIIIRQNFEDSARWLLFETGEVTHPYWASGTAFLLNMGGRILAVTARHACKDNWPKAVITDTKLGTRYAPATAAFRASDAWGAAQDSSILDVNVVLFNDDGDAAFFCDTPYYIDDQTICDSIEGDVLHVHGVLREKSVISELISPTFGTFDFSDVGQRYDDGHEMSDALLRRGKSTLLEAPSFRSLDGLSGAPVFNRTRNALCGMVLRAGMTDACGQMYYIKIKDIIDLARAVLEGREIVRRH